VKVTARTPSTPATAIYVCEWDAGRRRRVFDELAGEEPLEIRLDGAPLTVTMRTPGDDIDLAAGFLLTEGLVRRRDQIAAIGHAAGRGGRRHCNIVDVRLAPGVRIDVARLRRHFAATSSCGICGKTSAGAVRSRHIRVCRDSLEIDPDLLTALPDTLRSTQQIFGRTGGLHAAALFDRQGVVTACREDIGRHNAVDKVIGQAFLNGPWPLSEHVLMVSGRGGFEIIQKALAARVPVVASISAPSSLAVQLAREYRLTLVGFLRGTRFVVYSGEHRLTGGR
jgi:FdhD protein